MGPRPPGDDLDRWDLRRVAREEISRLPGRPRRPALLGYREVMADEETARRTGCPSGPRKERPARAREILFGRPARRGLGPSAAPFASLLPEATPAAGVPRRLVVSTVAAAIARLRAARSRSDGRQ